MHQMHPDDAAAVARARGGDQDAFRVLVERHGRNIYRLAYRMTGSAEDAEDVVQELRRAYRQLARSRRVELRHVAVPDRFQLRDRPPASRPHRETGKTPDVLDRLSPGPGPNDRGPGLRRTDQRTRAGGAAG